MIKIPISFVPKTIVYFKYITTEERRHIGYLKCFGDSKLFDACNEYFKEKTKKYDEGYLCIKGSCLTFEIITVEIIDGSE